MLTANLGAKIADLWAGTNPEEVKAEWARGMRGYTMKEARAAVDLLATRHQSRVAFAPTLPEFLSLCEQARKAATPQTYFKALPKGSWDAPNETEALRAKAREITSALEPRKTRWIEKLVERYQVGEILHPSQRDMLTRAGVQLVRG